MKRTIAVVIITAGIAGATVWAQEGKGPLTEKEVIKLIKKNKKDEMKAAAIVGERGVAFDVSNEFRKELQKAGASEIFYRAVIGASPSGRSFTTPLGEKLQVTPDEKADFLQIQSELEPARQIELAADFEKKYPQSKVLSYVLSQTAGDYLRRGDYVRTLEYGERSIKIDPSNVFSLVMVAMILPQTRMLQGTPAENKERVAAAETHASKALGLIEKIPAEMLEKDEELQKRKLSLASDAHSALGMVALQRDELPKAVDEFKAAIATGSGAISTNYIRLGEAYENMGKLDQAIEAFQNGADLSPGTPVQSYANQKIAEIKARKALVTP